MTVRWTLLASRDLDDALTWIADRNEPAATKVGGRIRQAAELLMTFPESGRPGSVAGTREKLCLPYPYVIVYEIRDTGDVWILRLYHMAQDQP